MTWDFRSIEFASGTPDAFCEIRAVYYHTDGRLDYYASKPASINWSTYDNNVKPLDIISKIKDALTKPILKESDFKNGIVNNTQIIKLSNDIDATVTNACHTEGLLCYSITGHYFIRTTNQIKNDDYDLKHSDLKIKILDEDAYLYVTDNDKWLDYSPTTLGIDIENK